MPIDCGTSFVDASEACNGRVLVCLQNSDTGAGFFLGFDLNGGPATGTGGLTTGFQSGNNPPPYTQDFTVGDNEPAGFQCFYVPYTVGTQSTDTLVIQGTDEAQNACELSFNVDTQATCNGNAPTCLLDEITVAPGQMLPASTFATGGTGTLAVTAIGAGGSGFFQSNGGNVGNLFVSPAPGAGTFTETITITDEAGAAVNCEIDITINLPDVCLECDRVTLTNVSSTDLGAGDVLTFRTAYPGVFADNTQAVIVDATGTQIAQATFVQTQDGVNFWQYLVPSTCETGTYTMQLTSPEQSAGCMSCDLFDFELTCICPDPVIDQCNNGQIQLQAGTAATLTVSGCECVDTNNGGSIVWSSPDSQLSFNPTNGDTTQVTASVTGSYTINVTCTTV